MNIVVGLSQSGGKETGCVIVGLGVIVREFDFSRFVRRKKKNKELPMLKKSKTETMYSFTDNPDWWVIVTEQENARPFVSVRCRDTRVVEMYHETSVKALEWANQEIKEYIEFCKKMGVSFF